MTYQYQTHLEIEKCIFRCNQPNNNKPSINATNVYIVYYLKMCQVENSTKNKIVSLFECMPPMIIP